MKTNYSKIIGLYSPDTWEPTPQEGKKFQNVDNFQFYFSDNDLKIITDKFEINASLNSNDTFFLGFGRGI